MEYNSQRDQIILKEYGRHVKKIVDQCIQIKDRDKRNIMAKEIIELMGQLNPHLRNVEDFRHKLWDHLFLISDFSLDVDSPYPIPTKETLKAKPEVLAYPKRYPKFNHLGKNIEVVIDKALKEENPEKKQGFANAIAYYMKLTYSNWHKELVHDDNIQTELSAITQGELEFNNRPFVKHRTDNRSEDDYGTGGRSNNNYRKNFGGRDNRNNGGRDNRNGGRDNRNGGSNNGGRNNNNRNFKKRY
jgi:hypothetical protein